MLSLSPPQTRPLAVALAACAALAPSLALPSLSRAASGTITTVAGVGVGDGLPALDVYFAQLADAVPTPDGGLIVSDARQNRIRKVAPDGTITTIAGNGLYGSTADGVAATSARLQGPGSLVLERDGSAVFVDYGTGTLRRIGVDGILTTIAGTGSRRSTQASSGSALRVGLSDPQGIAAGPDGTIYIADRGSRVVRKLAGGMLSVVAGNGNAGSSGDGGPATAATLSGPMGVSVASDGSLLIADASASNVRRVAPDGTIATVAGTGAFGMAGDDGPATAAVLRGPTDVAALPGGAFLIADVANRQVRKVAADGTITRFAGIATPTPNPGAGGDGGPATAASLQEPSALSTLPDGSVLIVDRYDRSIRRVDPAGVIARIAGARAGTPEISDAPALRVPISGINALTTTADGSIIAVDRAHSRVVRITSDGILRNVPGLDDRGPLPGSTDSAYNPSSLGIAPDGGLILGDYWRNRVLHTSPLGIVTSLAGSKGTGGFAAGIPAAEASVSPVALAIAPDGSIAFADQSFGLIRRITPAGTIERVAGSEQIAGTVGDGGPATEALLMEPTGLAYGPDGSLYIAEGRANTVRRISPRGIITRIAGDGNDHFSGDGGPAIDAGLNSPSGIAVAPDGTVIIADLGNGRVRAIATDGIIRTLAGTGDFGSTGDGGPATRASLSEIGSVAVAADGAVLIGEGFDEDGRIRRVDAGLVPAPAPAPSPIPTPAPGAPAIPGPAPPSPQNANVGATPAKPAAGLRATLSVATRRARPGSRVAFRVSTSRAARLVLVIRQGKRVVATLRGATPKPSTPATLTWTARRGRSTIAPGTYALTLTATTPDGATAQASGRVILRPRG